MIEVEFYYCHIKYQKRLKDHKRSLKVGKKEYCSLSCAGKVNLINVIEFRNPKNLIHRGGRKDQYTPFRAILRDLKGRFKVLNLTPEYIKEIWDKQEGKCAYTGVNLIIKKSKDNPHIYAASIDRIDSNEGYVFGNIQFVSRSTNYMKNSMTHGQTVELCLIIRDHWNKQRNGESGIRTPVLDY